MRFVLLAMLCILGSGAEPAGLVVYRSGSAIQFSDALTLELNGRDKALSLGDQPTLSGPVNKLPSVRVGGLLLRDGVSGVVAVHAEGRNQYLLPAGQPKNDQPNPAEVWKSAIFTYRKSQAEKTPVALSAAEFLAYLPDGIAGLPALCMNERALGVIGGKGGYFPMQIELLSSAVRAYQANPTMGVLDQYVVKTMKENLSRFDMGIESAKSLDQGLQFVKLSESAYPAKTDHQKLRKDLTDRKKWLDRKLAVLRALSAGAEPDAFLIAYRDFETHQPSFPDMAARHSKALEDSLQLHWQAGKDRIAGREYRSAYRELRLASYRQPANATLQKDLSVAWTEYSREIAVERQSQRKQLGLGELDAINKALHFADQFKAQNKLDDALNSVKQAETVDPNNLKTLLKKAEVHGARGEYTVALATLDQYDQIALNDERAAGSQLRNEFSFRLTTLLKDQVTAMESSLAGRKFYQLRQLAMQTLKADDRNADALFMAGVSHYVTRDGATAAGYFSKFLETSALSGASFERRSAVSRWMSAVQQPAAPAPSGAPHWFSGYPVPPDTLYCPISLAFTPKIQRIKASGKLTTTFAWESNRLQGIVSEIEKAPAPVEPIVFLYEGKTPQVSIVYTQSAKPGLGPSTNADDVLRNANVLLSNSKLFDPIAIERVTGAKSAKVVAGNRFFNPFVWNGIHYFVLDYDESGRARSATEVTGPNSAPGELVTAEFDWDGLKLAAIRVFQQAGNSRSQIYERKQIYQDNRLIGEEIRSQGKTSKIKYEYRGSVLVSADCDKDESLDARSREVFFAGAAGAGSGGN